MRSVTLLAALAAAAALGSNLTEALELYRTGRYENAAREFHELADRGKPDAYFYLRSMHAADHGIPRAQYDVSVLYAAGRGAEVDLDRALEWLDKAERSGDPKIADMARIGREKVERAADQAMTAAR